ncbi:DUF6177 family protein [Cryobacterium sp. SO2]|uniref:DUF6177 family protein n=1 Tax=Cryobacterium sp. SO2 TaxID=1897060 RepID=UPI00223E3B68|nr:DUF6177 family protein [Cryobacterium sp. SO2]WEO77913.1 DUF6177 family protein [Cryobacterium sp. SO2]
MTQSESVEHPLVDSVGDGYVVSFSAAPIVHASEGRTSLISECARAGLRVVFLTPSSSRLTFGMMQLLGATRNKWVVRDSADALTDGLTGRRLDAVSDVLRPGVAVDRADPAGHTTDASARSWLQLTVSVHLQARDETRVGAALAFLTDRVAGTVPAGWGVHEPAGLAWDRDKIDRYVRARMPRETRLHVTGRGDLAFSGVLRVTRSARGLVEETKLLVALDADDAAAAYSISAVPGVFADLAATESVLVGSAFVLRGAADLAVSSELGAPPLPVAMVLGPRAVRDLKIDLPDAAERFGAIRAGRPRIPSIVLPFTREGSGSWQQYLDVAGSFDPADVARALGNGDTREVAHAS